MADLIHTLPADKPVCPPMLPCSARSVLLPECIAVATPGGTGSDRSNGRKCLSSTFCRTRTRQRLASTPLQRNSRYLPPPPPEEVSWYFVLLLSISFCVHALLDAAAHSLSRPPISAGFSREARPPSCRLPECTSYSRPNYSGRRRTKIHN